MEYTGSLPGSISISDIASSSSSRPTLPIGSNSMISQLGSQTSIDLTGDSDDEDVVGGDARSSDIGNARASNGFNFGVGVGESGIGGKSSTLGPSPFNFSTSSQLPLIVNGQIDNQDFQVTAANISPSSNTNLGSRNNFVVPAFSYTPQQFGSSGFASSSRSTSAMPSTSVSGVANGSGWGGSTSGSYTVGINGGTANTNGYGNTSTGSAASPIDVTAQNLPSPPKVNDRKALCIGAIMSRAIMIYPSPAVIVGARPPEGSKERYEVVDYRGTEMLRVRLRYRPASTPNADEPLSVLIKETVQVLIPGTNSNIGELDGPVAEVLMPMMKRGLLRLEGFVVRLQPEAPTFQIAVNILLFTLPSNVHYISQSLIASNLYLLDPVPTYDPARHTDHPRYENAHGGGQNAYRMMLEAQSLTQAASQMGYSMAGYADREKGKQVEVQRAQMDEVFKTLESGVELDQSDPGPFINTTLFPHQRKALTFLLEREQDNSALKRAKKNAARHLKSKARAESIAESRDGESGESANGDEKGKEREKEREAKEDTSRSLWEGRKDEKGRTRIWKNKITGEEIRTKKGERPQDAKGAILADDMGLGKTLSVVSLIAATRSSARKWASTGLEKVPQPASDNEEPAGSGIKASEIKTKVFGMPDIGSDDEMSSSKMKKRKREQKEEDKKAELARRSRIVRRSRATLLVCPMSTITNWEDQIKEHWNGKVEIVGGAAGVMPPKNPEKKWKPPKKDGEESENDSDEEFDVLKVYIYHGAARRPDPHFIADFDVVITTYSTMANEYSKQAIGSDETPTPGDDDTAYNSSDEMCGDTSTNTRAVKPEVEAEIKAAEVADAFRKKAKKGGKLGPKAVVETSALQAIDWFRVVLDEAHYIKGPNTVASRASCYLEAERRICLTGTPIQNKIEDVWALFRFLRLAPVDERDIFQTFIASPCKTGEQIGVARLQLVMKCCTLRRTKDSTAEDGKKILNLPPRKETQLWLKLRDDERAAYDERASAVKDRVGKLKAKHELGKNYANILQEVLRLRQICDHVDLAKSGPVEEDYDGTIMDYEVAVQGIERYGLNQARAVSVICFLKDGAGAQCVECAFDYTDYFPSLGLGGIEEEKKRKKLPHKPILTKCQHLLCPKCFKKSVYSNYPKSVKGITRQCGVCSTALKLETDVIDVIQPCSPEALEITDQPRRAVRKKYVRPPGEKPNLSTKMQYLHDELLHFSRKNPNSPNYDPFSLALGDNEDIEDLDSEGKPYITKSVVFSQWTTMLDRIADMLDEANIRYARLDGTMTREERAKAMEALRSHKKVEVLLVSTRAGGVGLNLTAASRCYLVDPYWNPSVEAQAIDRIHRLGQTRPVTAIKLMIADSIEMRLDTIQKKKANLAQMSLKSMTRKELMEQKAEELASLFS